MTAGAAGARGNSPSQGFLLPIPRSACSVGTLDGYMRICSNTFIAFVCIPHQNILKFYSPIHILQKYKLYPSLPNFVKI